MQIDKKTWMLVGIFLWGVPTGVLAALITTLKQSKLVADAVRFDLDMFLNNLLVFVPLFALVGTIFGLIIFRVSTKVLNARQYTKS